MSVWLAIAREKFPHSAAANRISGDGCFALGSRCQEPRVELFSSSRRRLDAWNKWDDNGCCDNCTGKHDDFNLSEGYQQ
jgi:hypothetical protein